MVFLMIFFKCAKYNDQNKISITYLGCCIFFCTFVSDAPCTQMKRAHFKHKKQETKQSHKISIFIFSDLQQRQKQESNCIDKREKKEREREREREREKIAFQ